MRGLGLWKGELYDVASDKDGVVCIWKFECFKKTEHKVDCIPVVVLEWLMQPNIEVALNILFEHYITTHFCNEYTLISHSHLLDCYGKVRFVLYNMLLQS